MSAFEAYDPVGGETRRFKTRAAAERWVRGLGYGDAIGHTTITKLRAGGASKRSGKRGAGYCSKCRGPHVYKHGRA